MTDKPKRGDARVRLLEAAVTVIRAKGLAATTVDDLCAHACVSKGAFFHHFASKDDLAVAAVNHWAETTGALFAAADYHARPTAAERVLAYLDLRAALIQGTAADFSCLAGTMAQDTFATAPIIRDACGTCILDHAATLEADIAEALDDAGATDGVEPASLALHTQVVIQGAFVVAKAANEPAIVLESIGHLRAYLQVLFTP